MTNPKLLLFGGTGTVGNHICEKFIRNGWDISIVTRAEDSDANDKARLFTWNPLAQNSEPPKKLFENGPFDSVCWAQGVNCNDSIYSFDANLHRRLYDVNVMFIMSSLSYILAENALSKRARLCIISSIWQNISRQNKLSYGVTKSALHGLVLSLANDLARENHLVNAVLPGALDTPMTKSNLTFEQISVLQKSTQFNRLSQLEDVSNAVFYLCSSENTGLTGQFIKVDLGFSDVRNL